MVEPMTIPDHEPSPRADPACLACGQIHGAVNELIRCMRSYIVQHKARIASLEALEDKAAKYDAIRQLAVDYYAMRTPRTDESPGDRELSRRAKALKAK